VCHLFGFSDSEGGVDHTTEVHCLRQGRTVLVQAIQTLVPAAQGQAAIRRHRSARQHRRGRAIHPHDEGRMLPLRHRSDEAGGHATARVRIRRLVQSLPAAHVSCRQDTAGAIRAHPVRLPQAAIRTAPALASHFRLRLASSQGARTTRCQTGSRCRIPQGPAKSADRHVAPSRLTRRDGARHRSYPRYRSALWAAGTPRLSRQARRWNCIITSVDVSNSFPAPQRAAFMPNTSQTEIGGPLQLPIFANALTGAVSYRILDLA